MIKRTSYLIGIAVISGVFALSCQEPLVGAPCVPETDNGSFETTLANTTYGVETRSVQCETSVCITSTKVTDISADSTEPTVIEQFRGTQLKFSFCSCRCADADGKKFDRNDDELDDLCVCPGNSVCAEILEDTVGVAENIAGAYCIPDCILNDCEELVDKDTFEVCTPSSDDEAPWAWSCKAPPA